MSSLQRVISTKITKARQVQKWEWGALSSKEQKGVIWILHIFKKMGLILHQMPRSTWFMSSLAFSVNSSPTRVLAVRKEHTLSAAKKGRGRAAWSEQVIPFCPGRDPTAECGLTSGRMDCLRFCDLPVISMKYSYDTFLVFPLIFHP